MWQIAGPGLRLGASDTPEEIARKLNRDPDFFLVAEEEGSIIGTALGGFDGRRGLAYPLAVVPERRGRGSGTPLLAEMIK